ncbi:DNA-directed DNA polymerase [candidate division WWE3 bacterium CG_4_9_14_3_um_filter_41_6]|uniref:DNA-directed DNA polymerase n=1 Tax=candidate division WWE3 bacterium CG_4_10_14_0_2_um_filter_41_14 TaxID=1975072 RepID=A0A2M7TKP9_UNCKA|nr:MAG: DNA-directed DNA polymerase [candidate division WWE3 bacterium CG_4_10_14_0_2_um_filter_41_14]PJA38378.1 MAG: DNA-directed DNA polymerase [candidate division WWE3 bacterium CG_4_9_14_3_um_filter_41_6]
MPLYALIDCNNFFVSCERAFNPKLQKKPVAVLSSNDGCIVARSSEVKALGIKMGTPVFEISHILRQHNVQLLSSNYSLYADMSSRVMETIKKFSPEIEIYSVDEAFIRIDHTSFKNPKQLGKQLHETLLSWLGIPVSIGIAPSKTLAKMACELAKSNPEYESVCVLTISEHGRDSTAEEIIDGLLKQFPTREIWGVGRQYAKRFAQNGLYTAYDIKTASSEWLRKTLGISGLRLKYELSGISILPLNTKPKPPQSIMHSRTFARPINNITDLRQSIATFTSRVCETLRSKHTRAQTIHIRIETSRHNSHEYHAQQAHVTFPAPTDDTATFLYAARHTLDRLWEVKTPYKRAAVTLTDISTNESIQSSLFEKIDPWFSQKTKPSLGTSWMSFGKYLDQSKLLQEESNKVNSITVSEPFAPEVVSDKEIVHKKAALHKKIDAINAVMGKDTLRFASTGKPKPVWQSKSEQCSPRYTTHWDELLTVS